MRQQSYAFAAKVRRSATQGSLRFFAGTVAIFAITAAQAQRGQLIWDVTRLTNTGNYMSNVVVEGSGSVEGEVAAQLRFGGVWAQFGQVFPLPRSWVEFTGFSIRFENLENRDVTLGIRFDRNALYTDYVAGTFKLKPGEAKRFYLDSSGFDPMSVGMVSPLTVLKGYYTPTYPYVQKSLNSVYRWQIYSKDAAPSRVKVTSLYGNSCSYSTVGMVDRFGQSTRSVWGYKAATVQDLQAQAIAEDADIAAHPGPGETFGSNAYTATPTGRWRLIKTAGGKSYFVSPAGKFFWSFGADSVSPGAPTIVTGRESMFLNLPTQGDPRAQFYDTITRSSVVKQTYDHYSANLYDKLGPTWASAWKGLAGRRMNSWGMNTLGPGLDIGELVQNSMPFVWPLNTDAFPTRLLSPHAYWTPIPDPYSSNFQSWMATTFAGQVNLVKDDPRLLGIVVDSEFVWGMRDGSLRDRLELPLATLAAAASQPAKAAFVSKLQTTYGSIAGLNLAWGTLFASWNDLLTRSVSLTDTQIVWAQSDLSDFLLSLAKTYYARVNQALLTVAPKALYLGSKDVPVWTPDEAFTAQADYVDAITVDAYDDADHAPWSLLNGLPKPVLIAEFGFCSREGNAFPNLIFERCETRDNASRAVAARAYLDRALTSPNIVGALFYRYIDHPISGEADNDQNYSFGLVDVTDRPAPEMVTMMRAFTSNLYATRGQ